MLAVDFFTVETISLQRLYVLFFIHSNSSRRQRSVAKIPNDLKRRDRLGGLIHEYSYAA